MASMVIIIGHMEKETKTKYNFIFKNKLFVHGTCAISTWCNILVSRLFSPESRGAFVWLGGPLGGEGTSCRTKLEFTWPGIIDLWIVCSGENDDLDVLCVLVVCLFLVNKLASRMFSTREYVAFTVMGLNKLWTATLRLTLISKSPVGVQEMSRLIPWTYSFIHKETGRPSPWFILAWRMLIQNVCNDEFPFNFWILSLLCLSWSQRAIFSLKKRINFR